MKRSIVGNGFSNLDIGKLVSAMLVAMIHTDPFADISGSLNFYVSHVLTRLAVPFFFVCAGFFFVRGLDMENGRAAKGSIPYLLRYQRRLLTLYLLWSAIYLVYQIPYWHSIGWTGLHAAKDYVISLVLKCSHYHFWYLLSMLYGIPALYLLLRTVGIRGATVAAAICYGVKLLCYSYTWLPIPFVAEFAGIYDRVSGVADGICLAFPLMLLGVLFAGETKIAAIAKKWCVPGLAIAFLLLNAEVFGLVHTNQTVRGYSYILTTPLVAAFLFAFVLKLPCGIKPETAKLCRKISTFVYCAHPLVKYALPSGMHSFLVFVCVVAVTTAIGVCLLWLSTRKGFGFLRYLF